MNYKLKIEIENKFIKEHYGTNYSDLFDNIWEKICDVLISGDNFTLSEINIEEIEKGE